MSGWGSEAEGHGLAANIAEFIFDENWWERSDLGGRLQSKLRRLGEMPGGFLSSGFTLPILLHW
jgi:hypothetical protein